VRLTAPDPAGTTAAAAVREALRASGRRPEDVLVVNAHGSGTVRNDEAEARALTLALGGGPLVFATKGAFGHTLGATGAIEAITVLLALRSRTVPAVVGLGKPAPECAQLRLVSDRPARLDRTRPAVGLSLTLAFGGFNTCLVLEEAPHGGSDTRTD
jgi:3-oxoacyl-[acyl-carrier-protein] synthase II